MIKNYHKLVRDKIPQIIAKTGGSCVTRVLEQTEYIRMLDEKLTEELQEYQESQSLEELADLLEVMMAVVKARGYTWQQLEALRLEKQEKRGGFEERLLLEQVTERQ